MRSAILRDQLKLVTSLHSLKQVLKIGDLISDSGRFIESDKILQTSLSPIQYFNLLYEY